MALAFQSVAETNFGNTSSLTASPPSGVASGDLLVAQVATGNSVTITPVDSWTLIRDDVGDGTFTGRSALYYRVAGSSEPATYDFTLGSSQNPNRVGIYRFSGQHLTSPISANNGQANNSASTTVTSPGITPTANNILVFFSTCAGSTTTASGYGVVTDNPSWTEAYDQGSASLENIASAYAGSRPQTTATGNATATLSASVKSVGQLIGVAPAADVSVAASLKTMNFYIQQVFSQSSILRATITLLAPIVSTWKPLSKSTTTWTNQNKT